MNLLQTNIGRLRILGFLEGISFLVLLGFAMPMKYAAGKPEYVKIIGMAHGVLFILFVLNTISVWAEYKWKARTALIVLLASIIPFGTFVADKKILSKAQPAA